MQNIIKEWFNKIIERIFGKRCQCGKEIKKNGRDNNN